MGGRENKEERNGEKGKGETQRKRNGEVGMEMEI